MSSPFRFELEHADSSSRGRSGRWLTPHGAVETPAFMPVGTAATVKGLTPDQLREAGVQMVLANTYHLALRPGADVVADLGGLHRMMQWDGPILTDSGGFQVFSLARLTRLDDEKVVFRSHIDGSLFELSPERAVQIQEQLGADCIMCLDECPPHGVDRERLIAAVDRTTRWAGALPGSPDAVRSGPVRHRAGGNRSGAAGTLRPRPVAARFSRATRSADSAWGKSRRQCTRPSISRSPCCRPTAPGT